MFINYMSILRTPRSVRLRLEQIQRDFLWGEGLWSGRLILLNGRLYARIKGRVVWVLDAFLHLIEPFWVNGVGA